MSLPRGRPSSGSGSGGVESGDALSTRARIFEAIDRRLPYLLVAPALLIVVGLTVYPIAWAVKLSFYEVTLYDLDAQRFVGLAHYAQIIADPRVHRVLWNTIVFVGASVVGQLGLGLGLALLLDRDLLRDRVAGFFRSTYVVPWATTGVIVAYSWQFMFEPRVGPVNATLRVIGMADPPTWIRSAEWAMLAVVVANVWRGTPFSLVFQTSGLQTIPRELYDAAAAGGASRLRTIRHVTLPLLRPFILMNLVLITLFTVNVFDVIFVMTGGGPLESTLVLSVFLYETAFDLGAFGRASALAVVLFLINVVLVLLYLCVFGTGGDRRG